MPDEPLHTPTGKYWEAEAACTRPRRVQEKGRSDGLDNGTDPLLSLLTRQRRGARAGMFRGVFENATRESLVVSYYPMDERALRRRGARAVNPGYMAVKHARPNLVTSPTTLTSTGQLTGGIPTWRKRRLLTGTTHGIQGLDIGTYERSAELLGVPNNAEGCYPRRKSNPGFSGLQLSYGHLGGVGTGAVTRKERDHDEQEAS